MSIFIIIFIIFTIMILLSSCDNDDHADVDKKATETQDSFDEKESRTEDDSKEIVDKGETILKIGSLELDLEEPFETSISNEDGEEVIQLVFTEDTFLNICYEPEVTGEERIRMVDAHNKPNAMFGILRDEGWEEVEQSISPKEIKMNSKDVWQAQFTAVYEDKNQIVEIYQFLDKGKPITIYFKTIEEEFEKFSNVIIRLI